MTTPSILRRFSCLLAATAAISSVGAQTVYLNDTFENDTLGAAPATAAAARQTTIITGSGVIGTDQAARINDVGGDAAYLEYNVGDAPLGSLYISFDLQNLVPNPTGSATQPLIFGFSDWNTTTSYALNSNGTRGVGMWFYANGASGTLRLRDDSGSSILTTTYDMTALQSVEIFINDHGTNTLAYTRPDTSGVATLAANSAAFYVNGSLLGDSMGFTMGAGTTDGDATLGRFGFYSGGTNVSDFAIDNIYASSLSAVPEPSTYAAIFGAAALGLAAWRRRRHQAATTA
ncbi:PEP-CTERM sorting domain-containing protein [Actomonas aquatica]|uniref:PEP-CTERM sorting domain-containing protein n=1 Tax=Actomonas aquatica TaxID=2866162 RepID=A0ABZ1C996_9BACT|nr:PEP-CTERM sorting domain-containing protein [Opitutus sp. WL0086]WRQ87877.1 PEP-CTERM sorting domain-containing protein [Opitutus sp. WL0086]